MVFTTVELLGADSLQAASTGDEGSVREGEEADEGNRGTEAEDQVCDHCGINLASVQAFPRGRPGTEARYMHWC